MRSPVLLAAALLAATVLAPSDAHAQKWLERAKARAKEKVEQRVEQRTGEAVDKVLDGSEAVVRCAAGDDACREKAEAEGKKVEVMPAAGAPKAAAGAAAPAAAATAPAAKPGEGVWLNYDFKPGERPLFVDDFTKDDIGDFPRRLEFRAGNMEVVEWQGGRYLRAGDPGKFWIPLGETLPDRFTVEFDFYGVNKYELKLTFSENPDSPQDQVLIGAWGAGVDGDVKAMAKMPEDIEERMVKVRVMADGRYVKVYVDSQRVANVPNANLGRTNRIHVEVPAYGVAALIGNVRVMAGGRDLYDALAADGRVATQGIYFATGSDVIRPESTPTLKEIAAMLAEHADLRLTIEGHTDNVGDAAANKALSERRAAAVKQYLVEHHQVAADRLATAGFGDAKPAAPNTTPEGRQQNRRVELVRQ